MNKPSQARRKSTAYHEAAHAVIGRVLTLACGSATIEPNYEDRSWGVSICPDPEACVWEWERRGKVRSTQAAWIARTIHSMAGAEATAEFIGTGAEPGDEDDRRQIGLMLEEIADSTDRDKYEVRLRRMTRMLVRRHKVLIERVAKALMANTALSREELDKLVGRSVNDVRVNAPFLLAMDMDRPGETS